jgi:peroxiredoxin
VDLQSAYPQFQEKNAEVLGLAAQDVARAKSMEERTGASFPLLADPDHAAADAYGVFDLLGDGVATPSVFIVDPDGHIVWSYVGQNTADRPSADTILSHLHDRE